MVKKTRIVKFIRNTSISILILLVLFLVAGAAYTWYMGQNNSENAAAITAPIEQTPGPNFTPTKQADNVPTGASVQMISSPIAPGSNASISVKTNPEAICVISVIYDKTPSTDSGLTSKTSDEYGIVNWSWTVESSTPLGKWPVKVTCTHNEKSGVVVGDLVVSNKIEN